jgi:hypothetical protein
MQASPNQRFNHFINSGLITRKAGMTHYLKAMRKRYGEAYDYTPPSLVINKENQAEICNSLKESTKKRVRDPRKALQVGVLLYKIAPSLKIPVTSFLALQVP